jgi:uncharacterized membrane protein YebE (DUF533 family)
MRAIPAVNMQAVNEHALIQEYGSKEAFGIEGQVPDLRIGMAILAVAGADGELSERELTFLLGRAKQFGVSDDGIEQMASFDYRSVNVETVAQQVPRSLARLLLYDAILTARADGFAEQEREAARRWARALELDVSVVEMIERHLEKEDQVRAERIALMTG